MEGVVQLVNHLPTQLEEVYGNILVEQIIYHAGNFIKDNALPGTKSL